MRKIYLLSFVFFFFITALTAQKNNKELQAGVKLINELTFYNGLAPGFGGQIVYKKGKHSGIESGLYYQSRSVNFNFIVSTGTSSNVYSAKVAERRLLFPILYRFNSKILNFSAGPVMDYFLGWKTKYSSPGVEINSYDRSSLRLIGSAGISKSVNLSESLILEPEIILNYHLSEEDGGIGLNISLRKKLF